MGIEVDLQCPLLVDASSTLSVEAAIFANGRQLGAYMAQLPLTKERISEDYIPHVHV